MIEKQWNAFVKMMIFLILPFGAIAAAFIVLVVLVGGKELDYYTRDPMAIANLPPDAGLLSNICVLIWVCGAFISIFSGCVAWGKTGNRKKTLMLIGLGVVALYLAMDDLFMLHEYVIPEVLHIKERYTFLLYMIIILAGSIIFFKQILESEWILILSAGGLFGMSLLVDLYVALLPENLLFLSNWEDIFKIFGVCVWTFF